jgi:hypothetical protein
MGLHRADGVLLPFGGPEPAAAPQTPRTPPITTENPVTVLMPDNNKGGTIMEDKDSKKIEKHTATNTSATTAVRRSTEVA